jgi:serine/threonine-protein kinase NIM1
MVESISNEINIQSYSRRNSLNHQQYTQNQRNLNDFEKLNFELNNSNEANDATCKRIGFYTIGNELGSGNFSQVKLGIHLLTKGK